MPPRLAIKMQSTDFCFPSPQIQAPVLRELHHLQLSHPVCGTLAFHDAWAASADRLVRGGRYLPLSTSSTPIDDQTWDTSVTLSRSKRDVVHAVRTRTKSQDCFPAAS